jgi:hypothetical protein
MTIMKSLTKLVESFTSLTIPLMCSISASLFWSKPGISIILNNFPFVTDPEVKTELAYSVIACSPDPIGKRIFFFPKGISLSSSPSANIFERELLPHPVMPIGMMVSMVGSQGI